VFSAEDRNKKDKEDGSFSVDVQVIVRGRPGFSCVSGDGEVMVRADVKAGRTARRMGVCIFLWEVCSVGDGRCAGSGRRGLCVCLVFGPGSKEMRVGMRNSTARECCAFFFRGAVSYLCERVFLVAEVTEKKVMDASRDQNRWSCKPDQHDR
jgi:hypothetical protein